jgi:predicted metalloprotease
MRWEGLPGSENVEDRRGQRVGRGLALGGSGVLIVLVVSLLLGQNPLEILSLISSLQQQGPIEYPQASAPPKDELGQFASVVLSDTEKTWRQLFDQSGQRYEEPRLVLFTGAVQSGCGLGSAAVGPFYCQLDRKVYLDLSFFDELDRRFGAPGDFAAAYVIAHEIGHHVQNLTGTVERLARLNRGSSAAEANELSVRLELQADCLAGVWGHHAHHRGGLIEPGDFQEGLLAAAAIGDDRLQRMSDGQVQPETWTHGSSVQRASWLRRGLQTGDPNACDTFAEQL